MANGTATARRLVSPRLVGRDAELTAILAVARQPPAVVVVEGEAGVGKTRLVGELLARPELAGHRRLVGRCQRIRETFPLGPVIEALRTVGDDLRGRRLGAVTGALRPLLPELAELLPEAPDPVGDRQAERHRLFRGLTEVLTALGTAGPVVLVLEDLHWSDEHTLDFVAYWLAEPTPGLTLVLSYRSEDTDAEVRALTARLPATTVHEHVHLEPLDPAATGSLTAAILGTDVVSAEFTDYLWDRTGGLPLAVEEVLALMRARGLLVHQERGWARRSLPKLEVPRGIRDQTMHRVDRLPEPAQRLVEAAAVLQRPVAVDVLIETAGDTVDPAAVTTAIEDAIESGLLIEDGADAGFRHVIAAEAVYEGLSGPRRRALHGRAAAALRRTQPGGLGRIAYHLRAAGQLESWADAAEAAANQAAGLGNHEEEARLLADVLTTASLSTAKRVELASKFGWAALGTLDAETAIDILSDALDLDVPSGLRGELSFQLAAALNQAGRDVGRQRQLLIDAVQNLDDRPDLRARAMVALGIVSPPGIPLAEDLRWTHGALELVGKLGNLELELTTSSKAGVVLLQAGDPGWRAVHDRLLWIGSRHPDLPGRPNAHYSIASTACYTGHLRVAEQHLGQATEAVEIAADHRVRTLLGVGRLMLGFFRGEWPGLREDAERLQDELDRHALARSIVDTMAGHLQLSAGELDEAGRTLRSVVDIAVQNDLYDVIPLAIGGLARVGQARGRLDEAVADLEIMAAVLDAKGNWPPACWALPIAVDLWIAAGDEATAAAFLQRAQSALEGIDAPLAPAALRHAHGLLTGSADDLVVAAAGYDDALVPYHAARAREQAAELLLTSDRAADGLLQQAIATYERLAASWDHARAVSLGRRYGVKPARRNSGGRRSYGAELSPQERRVAELAATGRTNREIAAELFVSVKTVDKHMSAALRKLDVRTRTALTHRLLGAPSGKNGDVLP